MCDAYIPCYICVSVCIHTESVICAQLDLCYTNIFRICIVNSPGDQQDHFKIKKFFCNFSYESALRETYFINELYVVLS